MPIEPIILIDTREQCPLRIDAYKVERATLPVGDYGIQGFSDWSNPSFIVERKSLGDLVQSLTHDRDRLEREVLKLRQFRFAALIIEAERVQVEIGDYLSAARPEALLQSLAAFEVRHGLHVMWAGDARGAARTLERLVRQFVRNIENQQRCLRRASAAHGACAANRGRESQYVEAV